MQPGDQTLHNPNQVHDLRVQIDAVIQRIESEFTPSRELALVKTKLQEAKMWAGKELENLGSQLPAEFRDESQPAAPAHIVENPDEANQPPADTSPVAAPAPPVPDNAPKTPAGDTVNIPVTTPEEPGEVVVEPVAPAA